MSLRITAQPESLVFVSVKGKAPILLLVGPTGSGKTVSLKVVAQDLGIHIKEWVHPVSKTRGKRGAAAISVANRSECYAQKTPASSCEKH